MRTEVSFPIRSEPLLFNFFIVFAAAVVPFLDFFVFVFRWRSGRDSIHTVAAYSRIYVRDFSTKMYAFYNDIERKRGPPYAYYVLARINIRYY